MTADKIRNLFSDKEDDFVFASALLRASEGKLLGSSGILALAALPSESDVLAALEKYSFSPVFSGGGEIDAEETLLSYLEECYKKVDRAVPDAKLYSFLRIPYDCHNLKSAIKCYFRGADPSELYLPLGSIPTSDITAAVYKGRTGALPPEMADALSRVREAYERTLDPAVIDPTLDAAAYAVMIRMAKHTCSALLTDYFRLKIDLTNILTFVRLSRMKNSSDALDFLFIDGGTLSRSVFGGVNDDGVPDIAALSAELAHSSLSSLSRVVSGDMRELEKASDMLALSFIREAKNTLYGVDVPAAYLIERENEVRNVRLVISGKRAGLSEEQIRKTLRI